MAVRYVFINDFTGLLRNSQNKYERENKMIIPLYKLDNNCKNCCKWQRTRHDFIL